MEAERSIVEHEWCCSICGRPAGVVRVVPSGLADPRMGSGVADLLLGSDRVSVEAGFLSITIGGSWIESYLPAARVALAAGDADALHALDPESVPFWCPTCALPYCDAHWQTWDVREPDTLWWEERRGRCPEGHERMHSD